VLVSIRPGAPIYGTIIPIIPAWANQRSIPIGLNERCEPLSGDDRIEHVHSTAARSYDE